MDNAFCRGFVNEALKAGLQPKQAHALLKRAELPLTNLIKGNKYTIALGLLGHWMEKKQVKSKLLKRVTQLRAKIKPTPAEKEELDILLKELNND